MNTEHFCTLFDANFLPAGLCLHESLEKQGEPFHLWILCLDDQVEAQLTKLALSHVTLIPLKNIESTEILKVKESRTRSEYCWTLTPFLPDYVLTRNPKIERVTYLDADLLFFKSPQPLFEEFSASQAHALITDHAYAPQYDQSASSGRFCVQFLTFRNTPEAREIMSWWQARCIEWCFARIEDGKFGDQKYLDQWPELFGKKVHIVQNHQLTLAPWNAEHFLSKNSSGFMPVFFHFHGLRLISVSSARLFTGYRVGSAATNLYDIYVSALSRATFLIEKLGDPVPFFPESGGFSERIRYFRYLLTGRTRVAWFR